MNEEHQYSRLDIAFAQFLTQRTKFKDAQKDDLNTLLSELSYQQSQGHSCILLNNTEIALIKASELTSEDNQSPLILEKNRLFLQRYWFYEKRLAQQIIALMALTLPANNLDLLLDRYFIQLIDETDWQRVAAKNAITNAFSIITGGPGTGKTTTVVKILALLQETALKQNTALHIALAAPTGKAAMRLQESIGQSKNTLPCSEAIAAQIPETVTTLHRLLGAQPPSPYFTHDADNPLIYDLVVVDEASMIDLALMSKLVDALKPNSRLILLGDKDQLSSVESGAVLADLTKSHSQHTTELKKSFRFSGEIKALADAVNEQEAEKAWKILKNGQQVSLLNDDVIEYIANQYADFFKLVQQRVACEVIFKSFNQFRVLCSNRHGEQGVIDINQRVEKELIQQGKIRLSGQWYEGCPVMVTQNDYSMQLFNGDIGLYLYDKKLAKYLVFFLKPDGTIKKILPSKIPQHETVFAMTIHKSQGSEFENCLCILANKVTPVLTKELVYTAITRAKSNLKIYSSETIFKQTLQQKVERIGGLYDKLGGK